MCGIAGIVSFKNRPFAQEALRRMSAVIAHRGPDDSGQVLLDAGLGVSALLAHRRLKIIDLSPYAHQPMCNEDQSIWLIYNGEIYNYEGLKNQLEAAGHKFKSKSDSEVIIHAYEEWGVECLSKFTGMWAFAIWDGRKKLLFAARDRIGIKPFYYFYDGSDFVFASEIKAVLEYPGVKRCLDHQSLYEYLYMGYSLDDRTWIKGVRKLMPAHYIVLEKGNLSARRYWQPRICPDYEIEEKKAEYDLRALLDESVRLMLKADVEVGMHLSGGVDSSSVVAIANSFASQKIRTYSGIFKEGLEFDESFYINEAVKKYNVANEKILITPDAFIENMKKIVWHMDEPVAGPGAYPQFFISKLINSRNVKVVLAGQGGDELFGGYPHYNSGILDNMRSSQGKAYKDYYSSKDLYFKFYLTYLRKHMGRLLSFKAKRLDKILNRDILKNIDTRQLSEKSGFYKGSFDDMAFWDINNYLPALLHVEDRLSMAFSVETRLPLLNHSLVEYALKLPFYFKINSFNFKYILRMAMKNDLPRAIFERPDKKGFPTPVKIWLNDRPLRQDIYKEIDKQLSGVFTDKQISWERLNIGLWLKIFQVSL